MFQKLLEFYAKLVSKHLLDVYDFSLIEVRREQKEEISEYNLIFGSETIKLFTENLFESYKPNSFEADKFLQDNANLLNPNILREKLHETFLKNQTAIRSNNKIVSANRASVTRLNSGLNGSNNELVSTGNPNLKNNHASNYSTNWAPDTFDFPSNNTNSSEKNSKKQDIVEIYNNNNDLKSTEESLDFRVDKYLREKNLVSNSLVSSSRNTFNSNLESIQAEDLRPTAVFGVDKKNNDINNYNNHITNLLNEKQLPNSVPLINKNFDINKNMLVSDDKIQDLVSSSKDSNCRNNYINDIHSDIIIKNNIQPEKKFVIEEDFYRINSPTVDNRSGSLAESEVNILLKPHEKNSNDILYNNNNNKEKEIEHLSSPSPKDIYDNVMISHLKDKSLNKNQLDDVFGLFSKEATQPTINLNSNSNNSFNSNLNNASSLDAAKLNTNLLDFTQYKNPNYKINIGDDYKPEEKLESQSLIDVFKSNNIESNGKPVENHIKKAFNPFEEQEEHHKNQAKSSNLETKPNNLNTNNSRINNENNPQNIKTNDNKNNNNLDEYITNENFNPLTEEEEPFSLEDFREEALRFHNFKRLLHSAEGLSPSEELENRAQEWAEYLAEKETLEKQNLVIEGEEVGESLACISYFINGEKLIEEWYSQIEKYKFENPRKKNSTANFTQMVWKGTNFVGFGAKKSQSGYYFAVALYYPIGNLEGKYAENVMPIDQNIINQINEMNENENGYENQNQH